MKTWIKPWHLIFTSPFRYNRKTLMLWASVDRDRRVIDVFYADAFVVHVSFDEFSIRAPRPMPDFSDVEIIDWGQTLRLGEYEAASDAIRYGD